MIVHRRSVQRGYGYGPIQGTQAFTFGREDLMNTTRCAVQVDAGILPGTPESEYTKVWVIQSEQWRAAEDTDKHMLLIELAGKANAYATFLMLQPERLNWVKTEWIWF